MDGFSGYQIYYCPRKLSKSVFCAAKSDGKEENSSWSSPRLIKPTP